MKKTAENRYPHAATLFKFCKEALEIRYEGNVKVIDQDVGAILKYDPADCSHWKKGKKNIRALSTLKAIADHLAIDERLLIDIASGKVGLEEAVFEYRGYGSHQLQGRHLESLKKDFFRNPGRFQSNLDGTSRSFEDLFTIDRSSVIKVADHFINEGGFTEAPVYLPELAALMKGLSLRAEEDLLTPIVPELEGDGPDSRTVIAHRGSELRPYVRYLVAKEMYFHLIRSAHPLVQKLAQAPLEVLDIQANIFASHILVPSKMLAAEVDRIDGSLDIVLQLSELFWTSRSFMNQRLREYMESHH